MRTKRILAISVVLVALGVLATLLAIEHRRRLRFEDIYRDTRAKVMAFDQHCGFMQLTAEGMVRDLSRGKEDEAADTYRRLNAVVDFEQVTMCLPVKEQTPMREAPECDAIPPSDDSDEHLKQYRKCMAHVIDTALHRHDYFQRHPEVEELE